MDFRNAFAAAAMLAASVTFAADGGVELPAECKVRPLTPNVAELCRFLETSPPQPKGFADAGFTIAAVLHISENALAETACQGAVGKPITSAVAQLSLLAWDSDRKKELEDWLICVARKQPKCGVRSASVAGLVSALPNRYRIAVAFKNGVVTACEVKGAPGW